MEGGGARSSAAVTVDVGLRPRLAHTSALRPAQLAAIRSLLDAAFDGMDEHDWEHALGGIHATVWEAEEAVAHGSVTMRRLILGGRALRCGYVEAVATRPDRRRRGHGRRVMEALGDVIRGAYDIGALAATDMAVPLYTGLGWRRWEGELYALTPSGTVRTPDEEGAVYVLPVGAAVDLTAALTCDWRDGDVW
jgi:aminoglycoside 2'-N-acetyltransferase I